MSRLSKLKELKQELEYSLPDPPNINPNDFDLWDTESLYKAYGYPRIVLIPLMKFGIATGQQIKLEFVNQNYPTGTGWVIRALQEMFDNGSIAKEGNYYSL